MTPAARQHLPDKLIEEKAKHKRQQTTKRQKDKQRMKVYMRRAKRKEPTAEIGG